MIEDMGETTNRRRTYKENENREVRLMKRRTTPSLLPSWIEKGESAAVTKTSGRWEQNRSYGSGPRAPTGIDSSSREFGVVLLWRQDGRPRKPRLGFVRATGRGAQIAGSGERGTHGESSRARSRPPCFGPIRALASAGGPLRQAGSLGRRASERTRRLVRRSRPHRGSGHIWQWQTLDGRVARAWAPRSGTSPPHHRIYPNNPPGHIRSICQWHAWAPFSSY